MNKLSRFFPVLALMLILSACARPKGVIVETLEPPRLTSHLRQPWKAMQ